MSFSKVDFVNGPLEVFKVVKDGENWMVANPFAEALGYVNCKNAITKFVSPNNQKMYEEIKPATIGATDNSSSSPLPRTIQAKTKFINSAGVVDLVMNSHMEYARQFRYWLVHFKLQNCMDPIAEFETWKKNESNKKLLLENIRFTEEDCCGTVYVVTNELYKIINLYKIGFTANLQNRLAELNVASAFDFKPVFLRSTDYPRELEQKLHHRFAKSKVKREFFKLTDEEVALLPLLCDNLVTMICQ
jgi:hypothetical protein